MKSFWDCDCRQNPAGWQGKRWPIPSPGASPGAADDGWRGQEYKGGCAHLEVLLLQAQGRGQVQGVAGAVAVGARCKM